MTIESAVRDFGYFAIFVGTFLEGETILIIGGFAAFRGYLELPFVILSAFFGSLFGDQLYFFLGRYKGQALLKRFKSWEPRIRRFNRLMERHSTWFILIFRFLYGLRNISPVAIGLSDVSTKKFVILNVISAAIWAVTLGVLGFFFGQAAKALLHDVRQYEMYIFGGILGVASIMFITNRVRNHLKIKKRKQSALKGSPRDPAQGISEGDDKKSN